MTVPNNGGTAGSTQNSGQWNPTVSYLVLLVIAEYATLCVLRYVFRSAHGG